MSHAVIDLMDAQARRQYPLQRMAGRKGLSILQAAVVSAGLRGTRVLQAACEDELAGTRLADGMLRISPGLCDALIEMMTHLWIEAVLTQGAGHAA